jgi:nucleotide-binding universal stress UspA family protein
MFQRILVPLDGSTRSELALPVAARIARAAGGSVVLLHVVSVIVDGRPFYVHNTSFMQAVLNDELAKAREYLVRVAHSDDLLGIKTETEATLDVVAQTILTYAQSHKIDIIVMSSHGLTGFKRWALGSVAQKVVRHSPVPVLLLREGGPRPADLHSDATHPFRALVALDGSPLAEAALEPTAYLVAALAAPAAGALHLTQVVKPPTIRSEHDFEFSDLDVGEQALQEAVTYLSALADNLGNGIAAELGLKVTWSATVHEDVADALIRMAELGEDTGTLGVEGSDLIAISTHGRGGSEHWMMGSITERVLDGTKLPLFIVCPVAGERGMPQEEYTQATAGPSKEEAIQVE